MARWFVVRIRACRQACLHCGAVRLRIKSLKLITYGTGPAIEGFKIQFPNVVITSVYLLCNKSDGPPRPTNTYIF